PDFLQSAVIYHPDTIVRSRSHDGSGPEPGYKHDGNWDRRPHLSRIQRVNEETLTLWRDVLENPDASIHSARMLYTVNRSAATVLGRLAQAARVSEMNP